MLLGNLKILVFINTTSWAPWISQVQSNGLPSIIVSAQPGCILSMIFFALKTSTCCYSVCLEMLSEHFKWTFLPRLKKLGLILSCFYYEDACMSITVNSQPTLLRQYSHFVFLCLLHWSLLTTLLPLQVYQSPAVNISRYKGCCECTGIIPYKYFLIKNVTSSLRWSS